ncbi:MAG: hypothetical protein HC872_08055 [Gammaproteobacteria bacterium]|nr:hypothetical protein [Gammaproteobacteria bacterium]
MTVDLHVVGVEVRLAVTDNGSGMQPGVELAQGMGLRIMRYRAHIVGGGVEILAAPGGGVKVLVSCRQPAVADALTPGAAS